MVASQVDSLISLLRSSNTLQKTLRVSSFINCVDEHLSDVIYEIAKKVLLSRQAVIFKDEEDELVSSKSIAVVDNGIKYLLGKNLFCTDIFKSKYNQEVLRIAGFMSENEFKSLDLILFDATSMFNKFLSKILKISDNILILANTSQDSLYRMLDKVNSEELDGQDVQIIFINEDNNLDWHNYFENFNKAVLGKCNANFKILDFIGNGFLEHEVFKLSEKIYLNSIKNSVSKNLNFFDFVINLLN